MPWYNVIDGGMMGTSPSHLMTDDLHDFIEVHVCLRGRKIDTRIRKTSHKCPCKHKHRPGWNNYDGYNPPFDLPVHLADLSTDPLRFNLFGNITGVDNAGYGSRLIWKRRLHCRCLFFFSFSVDNGLISALEMNNIVHIDMSSPELHRKSHHAKK